MDRIDIFKLRTCKIWLVSRIILALQHERRGAYVSNACERCEGARSGARVLLVFVPDPLKTSHSLALLTGSNLSSPLMPMRGLAEFRLNFSGFANWCTSFNIWERSLCIHDRRSYL